MPRLSRRMSGQRRHGALQERVPRGVLEAAWDADARPRAGPRARDVALGIPSRPALELGGAQPRGPLAERASAGTRPTPHAPGVDADDAGGARRAPKGDGRPTVC